jgi:hypothetical protein
MFPVGGNGPGQLWPVMKHLVASLIMAYGPMRIDGFNIHNCTTIDKLVAAVVAIERVEAIEAEDLLKKWSASIRSEFDTANAAAAGMSPTDNASILTMLHSTLLSQAAIREDLRLAREEVSLMRQEHAQDRRETQHTLAAAQHTLAAALAAIEGKKDPVPAVTAPATTTTTSAAPAPAPAPALSKPPRMLAKFDMTTASAKSDVTKNTKQPLLRDVLEVLSRADKLRMASMGTLGYNLPQDAAIVKRTFRFVKTCITDAQWDVLIKPIVGTDEGRDSLKDVCRSIQDAVGAKLDKYKPAGSRAVLNVVGINNRIKARAGGAEAWYTETPAVASSAVAPQEADKKPPPLEADEKPPPASGWGIFGLGGK